MWRAFRNYIGNYATYSNNGTQSRAIFVSSNNGSNSDENSILNSAINDPDVFGTFAPEDVKSILSHGSTPATKFTDVKKQIENLKETKVFKPIYEEKTSSRKEGKVLRKFVKLHAADASNTESVEKMRKDLIDDFGTTSKTHSSFSYVGDDGDKKMQKYEECERVSGDHAQEYAKRMKSLVSEGKLREAISILEDEMPNAGVKPDLYCYRQILKGCEKIGHTKKAFKIYNKLLKDGLLATPVIYTLLFSTCGNCPYPEEGLKQAKNLLEQVKAKQLVLNQINYNSIIKAFGRCGDPHTALSMLDEMVEEKVKITQTTISFAFQTCVSDKESGFRLALMVWRKMRTMFIPPTLFHFNLLLKCAQVCKAGDPALFDELLVEVTTLPPTFKEKVKELKPSVPRLGSNQRVVIDKVDPEVDAVNVQLEMIKVQEKTEDKVLVPVNAELTPPMILAVNPTLGSLEAVTSLDTSSDRLALLGGFTGYLAQMKQYGVSPDLKTFTQLLSAMGGSVEQEDALMETMKTHGVKPDTTFCNMLMKKRNMRKQYEEAKDVLPLMVSMGLSPDILTFGCLSVGCNNIEKAEELFKYMDTIGCRPNNIIMDSLLNNCIAGNKFLFTLFVLKRMKSYDIGTTESVVKRLEVAKRNARHFIKRFEKEELDMHQQNFVQTCRVFLYEYSHWLKDSKLSKKDHPWALEDLSSEENSRQLVSKMPNK